MDEVLAIMRAFVAGDIGPLEFRDHLYNDEGFEVFLKNDPHLRRQNYAGEGVYLFLLQQDYDDPRGVLSAHGALVDFMERNDIDHSQTTKHGDFYDLILEAQPRWLHVDARYVSDQMIPAAEGRTGKELRAWLREDFLRRFRYAESPPSWIQSPDWPIGKNGPLVFLGQLEIKDYFHDLAAAYVFHDPTLGTTETIIQVY